MSVSKDSMDKVIKQYFEAWEEQDSSKLVRLFSEDGIYRVKPFGLEEYHGSKEIKDYWETHPVAMQLNPRLKVIRVAFNPEESICFAEWENTFTTLEGTKKVTSGMLVLEFDGDHIRELREHYMSTETVST